jgi:type IV pilus assembly protein PilB
MEWLLIVTPEDLRRALDEASARRSDAPLGQVLLEAGLVDRAGLGRALGRQADDRTKPLGRILVEEGMLDPVQVAEALALKCGIPCVRLEGFDIPAAVAARIPAGLALRHRAVPLADIGSALAVALENPFDAATLDLLRFNLSADVIPVMAARADIALAQARLYAGVDDAALAAEDERGAAAGAEAEEREANRRDIVRLADAILRQGILRRASDINIRPDRRQVGIHYRIDGRLQRWRALGRGPLPALVSRIKIIGGMNIAERRLPQEGSARLVDQDRSLDLRISVIPTVNGESVVIRILDRGGALRPLAELGLPGAEEAAIRAVLGQPHGLFLVTGPTGSGKSTTLSALLGELRRTDAHILTVEDPVEYDLEGIEQVQVSERIGLGFAEVLRRFLRHDPDVIMVGEVRDRATAAIACQAALTGHFVLSTLHTNDAPGAVARLLDMGVEPFILAATLRGVMAQRLLRLHCPRCRGGGCAACAQTGYRGRRLVCEVMTVDAALAALIAGGAPTRALAEAAEGAGMTRLGVHALAIAAQGGTSREEALAVATDPNPSAPEAVIPARAGPQDPGRTAGFPLARE